MDGANRVTKAKLAVLEARVELAEAELERVRGESGLMTRCVFCTTPIGWAWLPVDEFFPGQGIEGEWVPNDQIIPSPREANEGDACDALPLLSPLFEGGLPQISHDLAKDFLLAQRPIGPHVVEDQGLGVPPQMADGR